ncbi:MAG: sortase [Dehalococcoidia bacterium]|nr:MAG: sortase [Dehalococcoidia bacterium]
MSEIHPPSVRGASRTGRRASRSVRWGATAAVVVLASACGFLMAGTGLEVSPQSAAYQQAAAGAAARIASGGGVRPQPAPWRPAVAAEANPVEFIKGSKAVLSPAFANRVVIRSVGIDAVVQPVGLVFTGGKLQYDVPYLEAGQYVGSAQPGRPGNAVIGGHVSRRGTPGVFAKLPKVAAGDVVEVFRGDQIFRYSVTEIRVVASDATGVMSQTQDATLTLITCFPDDALRERLVVVGKLM